jgi:hypothetical protein
MSDEEYVRHLGGLISNLLSLEMGIRAALGNLVPRPRDSSQSFFLAPVGTEFSESDVTSYESLGQLIDRYNSQMRRHGKKEIDETIVDLRDALAHGRLLGSEPNVSSLRLIKFSKPKRGRVRVEFNQQLSAAWFTDQKARLIRASNLLQENSR